MQDCLTHVCPVLQMAFPLVLNNKFSLFKKLNKDNIEITKKKKKITVRKYQPLIQLTECGTWALETRQPGIS